LKLFGVPDLITQVGDIRLRISPTSFFQVNHSQAAKIYQLVRDWAKLTGDEIAYDLYCGIGGIALNLAKGAAKVIGIEVMDSAVRNARENALLNKLKNCEFRVGDASDLLRLSKTEPAPSRIVTLNPPRGGCDHKVLETAAALKPRTLIYVSCNPETLARDLEILCTIGLQTEAVQPVDMFPQTPHVETVVRLHPVPRKKLRSRP
jgi:23S rRNA (uracil1939-C5)-methyltransferase